MARRSFIGVVLLACFFPALIHGKKRHEQRPDITKLHVSSDIRFRYSTTTVESHVNNYNSRASEVVFRVTLPKSAFISRFSMVIDNVTYAGSVEEKEAANERYEKAKSKGQSAGIVRQKPRDSNVFSVNVNVAAKGAVDFTLVYEELLARKFGKYQQIINVDPGQIVFDLFVRVSVDESRPLTRIRAPPIKSGNEVAVVDDDAKNSLAVVRRVSESRAIVEFAPSKSDQKAMGASGMSGQFSVEYDVDHEIGGGEIQVVDGYFVHFFSPADLKHLYKHVYFVLDVSGSMSGRKMEQMISAMLEIMDDLKEGDLFTIMKFSDDYQIWRHAGEKVHSATPTKIAAARSFIEGLVTEGSINIYDSLRKAILDLNGEVTNAIGSDSNSFYRANVVVFLTDGQPTAGAVTHTGGIVKSLTDLNVAQNVVLYSLGFGDDVDFTFLQRLSLANGGFARKIYASSDAALQLVDFYQEISSPLLANVKFVYLDAQIQKDSLTETNFRIFYEGTEIVIAGKVADSLPPPPYVISSTINGTVKEGEESWWCGVEIDRPAPIADDDNSVGSGYLERLWAYLTIQQLLDKKTATMAKSSSSSSSSSSSPAEIEAIDARVLKMALEYEFVTPLTAMVVTKPEVDERGGRGKNVNATSNVVDGELDPEMEDWEKPYNRYPVHNSGSSGVGNAMASPPHYAQTGNSHGDMLHAAMEQEWSDGYTYDSDMYDMSSSYSGKSGGGAMSAFPIADTYEYDYDMPAQNAQGNWKNKIFPLSASSSNSASFGEKYSLSLLLPSLLFCFAIFRET